MSSQGGHEISFTISAEQQHFRLLELPPELLTVLSSDNPPILHLKSSEAENGSVALCTEDKTFDLRQAQSSNTVFIAKSTSQHSSEGSVPQAGISAISQCNWSLELSAAKEDASLEDSLRRLLPVYTGQSELPASRSRGHVFDDIPRSNAECDRAWISIAAFETGTPAASYRPSASASIKAWTAIYQEAIAQSLDLSSSLLSVDIELLCGSNDEILPELRHAIILRLLEMESQQTLRWNNSGSESSSTSLTLDRGKTVRWVGENLLETLLETSEAELVDQWQNLLPEAWRDDAKLSAIEGSYERVGPATIRTLALSGPASSSSQTVSATPTATGVKRKWHDKFKQTRNKR